MTRRRVDIIGERFGLLVAREYAGSMPSGKLLVRCDCDCGGETMSLVCNLRGGASKSCGCVQREKTAERNRARATHGLTGSRTYGSVADLPLPPDLPAENRNHRIPQAARA